MTEKMEPSRTVLLEHVMNGQKNVSSVRETIQQNGMIDGNLINEHHHYSHSWTKDGETMTGSHCPGHRVKEFEARVNGFVFTRRGMAGSLLLF